LIYTATFPGFNREGGATAFVSGSLGLFIDLCLQRHLELLVPAFTKSSHDFAVLSLALR
jgi:hypothetical protein